MDTTLEILEARAMTLTVSERAALAQRLLASLDEDQELDDAWAAELDRRIAAVESGEMKTIPIAEALAQVRATLE